MNAFYLISIILGLSAQNVTKKMYNRKTSGGGAYLFSMLTALGAALFFLITGGTFTWDAAFLPYSLAFGTAYAVGTVFSVLAVREGSLSLTSLMISYSLMIPAFYGVFFLHETVSIFMVPGLLLLAISLVLIHESSGETKISLKWVLFALLAFLGNGFCTVAQKAEQVAFDGMYKNEFMICALLLCALGLGIIALINERKEAVFYLKKGTWVSLLNGVINGMMNLFIMFLSARMPVSLMFPLISAGGIIVTYIVSRFFYGEKLSRRQFIGFLLGIGSIIFLNL